MLILIMCFIGTAVGYSMGRIHEKTIQCLKRQKTITKAYVNKINFSKRYQQ